MFIITWLELQQNCIEYWMGGVYIPTPAHVIIESMQCDLSRREGTPSATLYVPRICISGIEPGGRKSSPNRPVHVDASFHRRELWSPELFPYVPKDVRIEHQQVVIPTVILERVLGSIVSVRERIFGVVLPALTRQLRENFAKIVTLENFGAWLESKTEGMAENLFLKDKAEQYGFEYQRLSNEDIWEKHRRRFYTARSQQALDLQVYHLLWDWDHNHVGFDMHRRRSMAVVVLNFSSEVLQVKARLKEGDKLQTLRQCLATFDGSKTWSIDHTTVIFAYGNVPILSMLGAATGELEVQLDCSVVQMQLKHEAPIPGSIPASITWQQNANFNCSLLECASRAMNLLCNHYVSVIP